MRPAERERATDAARADAARADADELWELEEQARIEAVKATAGKGKKAKDKLDAASREADNMEYKLHVRQQAELDLLREHLGGGDAGSPFRSGYSIESETVDCFMKAQKKQYLSDCY